MTTIEIVAEPEVPQVVITRAFAASPAAAEHRFPVRRGPRRVRSGRDGARHPRLDDQARRAHHARAFAREGATVHMIEQGSGVILTYGGYGDPVPNYGGFQVSFGAVEALRRTLSKELGPKGVRVITLQTGGIPEGIPNEKTRNAIEKSIADGSMLGRAATLADVGNVAVFAASDWGPGADRHEAEHDRRNGPRLAPMIFGCHPSPAPTEPGSPTIGPERAPR